jgi:hypothetical protein
LTDQEIAAIPVGPSAPAWDEEDRAVLCAVDDLRREAFITEAVWNRLTKYFDTRRLIELIMTSGGYAMTGVVMASIGLQVEPGLPGFPEVSPT